MAAYTVMEALRGQHVSGILALGDRPAAAAAYAARGLGVYCNHPAAVEACRDKLRLKEIFRCAGLGVPLFLIVPMCPPPQPILIELSCPCRLTTPFLSR